MGVVSGPEYYESRVSNCAMLSTQKVPGFNDLSISVGSSKFGLGLFIAISEDAEAVHIPRGTLLCEYAGRFDSETASDKAVGFGFFEENDIHSLVYYDNRLQHLWEVIYSCSSNMNDYAALRGKLEGHLISVENNEIQISRDLSYEKTRFVPIDAEQLPASAETYHLKPENINFGCYANDLAFDRILTLSESHYRSNYPRNCLKLVWKLCLDNMTGVLVPVNPVVVSRTSVTFNNRVPMEIGFSYGSFMISTLLS
jgi:hypothetical protein